MKTITIFFLLIFTSFLQAQEKTYQIGIYGDLQTIDKVRVDKIKKAWELAGLKMSFVDAPAERSLRDAASGRIDGNISRFASAVENYLDLIQVPVPIEIIHLWVYIPTTNTCFDMKNLNKMKPVGVIGIRYFKRVYLMSNNGYEQVTKPVLALKMLDSNRADYTVANEVLMQKLMQYTGIKMKKCFPEPLFSDSAYTYIHSKNIHILERLTKSYRKVFNIPH
ncbi:MAG: hypothetical protein HRU38_08385 [Saccharospirillaceae bacterium]|nr:hypothetical protein [Pseudomonadales bacterium]NRB78671.1 hypothetical protein [Saccharospirillaceae bacterium]